MGFAQVASQAEELEKVLMLAEELSLSKEQTSKFKTVLKKHGQAAMKALAENKDDVANLRKSMKAIQTAQDQEVASILSESQYELYTSAMKKDRIQRRRAFLKQSRAQSE